MGLPRRSADARRALLAAEAGLFSSWARFAASLLRAASLPICSSARVYSRLRSSNTRTTRCVIDGIAVRSSGKWLSCNSRIHVSPDERPSAFHALIRENGVLPVIRPVWPIRTETGLEEWRLTRTSPCRMNIRCSGGVPWLKIRSPSLPNLWVPWVASQVNSSSVRPFKSFDRA